MRRVAEVEAPAKINLFLRVRGRRPDGYHDVRTVYQSVALADRVVVSLEDQPPSYGGWVRTAASPVYLTINGPDLGPIGSNLAYRAARRFQEVVGVKGPVRIELVKRIPAGAGLGGGSSDAAAVLKALASLTGFDDGVALHAMATDLGSDVPFFLADSPLALGEGRGERLTELTPLPEAHVVLGLPDVHVDTGEAYAALAAEREGREVTSAVPEGASAATREGKGTGTAGGGPGTTSPPGTGSHGGPPAARVPATWADVAALAANDFESVIVARHQEVRASLGGLRIEGASVALLSGSGAACFGIFRGKREAEDAAGRLSLRHPWRFVATRTRTTVPMPRSVTEGGAAGA